MGICIWSVARFYRIVEVVSPHLYVDAGICTTLIDTEVHAFLTILIVPRISRLQLLRRIGVGVSPKPLVGGPSDLVTAGVAVHP